ncbi:hypothetical protein OSL00_23690, partial [Escherichia coli]|nr:hypothetical protein [Escherichia coli]
DRNRSHWSTSKTPSYTKSVSWQHHRDVDLYYPGASLGIVEVDPETTDADSALHAVDIAMYQEKKHKQKTPFVAHPALHS